MCDQCEAVSINGVACHEHGCPNSHLDAATGVRQLVECAWCGNQCEDSGKGRSYCDDACYEDYWS